MIVTPPPGEYNVTPDWEVRGIAGDDGIGELR
jgi:hypothetical protein